MKRVMMLTVGLCVASLASAIAQPPGGDGPGSGQRISSDRGQRPPMPLLQALDANHDGELSAKEIDNASAALLTLDKNKDGMLSEDEIRPAGRGPGEGPPRRPAGAGPDGVGPDGPPPGGREAGPGRGPGGGRGVGGPMGPNPDRMLSHAFEFDADNDGKLNKDEMRKFIADFIQLHEAGGPGFGGPGFGGPRGPRRGAGGPPDGAGRAGRPDPDGPRPERPRRPE